VDPVSEKALEVRVRHVRTDAAADLPQLRHVARRVQALDVARIDVLEPMVVEPLP